MRRSWIVLVSAALTLAGCPDSNKAPTTPPPQPPGADTAPPPAAPTEAPATEPPPATEAPKPPASRPTGG